MNALNPAVRIINSKKPSIVKLKNTDNLEVITDSDSSVATISPSRPKTKDISFQKANIPKVQPSPNNQTKSVHKSPKVDVKDYEYFLNSNKKKIVNEDYDNDESEDIEEDDYSESESESSGESSTNTEKKFEKKIKSTENKKFKKQELLGKLLALKARGVELTKNYDSNSSLEDIEFEYYLQKKRLDCDAAIKFQQKGLMAVVTGLEYLNKNFDPIGAKLDGWSESVMDSIDDYNEVFRKLYEKYSSRAELPVELELIMLVCGSAFMYHMTNTFLKSAMPNISSAFNNPEVFNNINNIINSSRENQTDKPLPAQENMTSPSINLSRLINTETRQLPIPENTRNTKQMYQNSKIEIKNNDIDRFSVMSSETTQSNKPKRGRNVKSQNPNLKTITI